MALQKKRRSKSNKRLKRSAYWMTAPNLIPCPSCQSLTRPHRVCIHCGSYKNKVVVVQKEKTIKKD